MSDKPLPDPPPAMSRADIREMVERAKGVMAKLGRPIDIDTEAVVEKWSSLLDQ